MLPALASSSNWLANNTGHSHGEGRLAFHYTSVALFKNAAPT